MCMDIVALWQRVRPPRVEESEIPGLARAARHEMEAARRQFDEVSDPDLVDHAIFRLQAAERHFVFIVRQARRPGV